MNEKILVVDDEAAIVDLIKMELEFEGYQVETAYDGEEAIEKGKRWLPDLIVLDIMLPKVNGYDVCKTLSPVLEVPIILLTAKTDIVDKVLGLELGADDYLTKPFDNRELLARIKAHLRRSSRSSDNKSKNVIITNGPLSIMPEERMVLLEGNEIHLTPKEFDLLYLLASNLEQVFPRDALLEKIWGYDYYGDTRTVDMHVQRIRRKIDTQPNKFIQTVFGIGYKMRKI
ncbi:MULTISPECIES: response regulator transcription factor [Eubacterium]|uniref:Stage 0 sporulation protein A homolog n=2 Tax=Eubacterium TaxID=1730 RepID=A0A1H3XQ12_9FIRM|nr:MULTISPECIES: response regulator transcription factor [Eubacterium]MDD4690810.1 response regulator transcription factor [Eubacterium aggregans]MEA5072694.1 response regulator transcription factor [Eubacterium aggregans]SDX73238.1 two-component system, OmpR family, response regulator VicR [Eubacterium barkeri]SEA01436.1 two-component system, OmpR family, response regulator VicR [Eubacterium aggregans]